MNELPALGTLARWLALAAAATLLIDSLPEVHEHAPASVPATVAVPTTGSAPPVQLEQP